MKKHRRLYLKIAFSICLIYILFFLEQNSYAIKRGGILKSIQNSSTRVLGYYPEMGPGDSAVVFPAIERLMDANKKREFVPFLAEAVDLDDKNLTMTFHLRKGVKFHDGSEMTGEVVAWNFQMQNDAKKIQYGEIIKSIEVLDKYTVILHLSEYNNQMMFAYGWTPIFSKNAFD